MTVRPELMNSSSRSIPGTIPPGLNRLLKLGGSPVSAAVMRLGAVGRAGCADWSADDPERLAGLAHAKPKIAAIAPTVMVRFHPSISSPTGAAREHPLDLL